MVHSVFKVFDLVYAAVVSPSHCIPFSTCVCERERENAHKTCTHAHMMDSNDGLCIDMSMLLLHGYIRALQIMIIINRDTDPASVAIFTDSMSTLQTLDSRSDQTYLHILALHLPKLV